MKAVPAAPTGPANLQDISGVGPTLARRVQEAYGSIDAFVAACHELDLDRLLALEGVSERRAFELVAHVRNRSEVPFAATERARGVQRDLEDRLSGYAQTDYGRRFLRLLPILREPHRIRSMQDRALAARDLIERGDRRALQDALKHVTRLREPARTTTPRRLVLVDNDDEEHALRARGLDRWCGIQARLRSPGELDDYEVVIYAGAEGDQPVHEAANVVRARREDPESAFVPERALEFARCNRTTLEALNDLAGLTGRVSAARRALDALDSASKAQRHDVEGALRGAVDAAQRVLEEGMAGLSLTGAEILQLIGQSLPKPLYDVRARAGAAARQHLRATLGRDVDLLSPGLPLRLDDEEAKALREEVAARSAVDRFERFRASAQTIDGLRDAIESEVRAAFAFDVDVALGCFVADFDARPADSGAHLSFEGGIHAALARDGTAQRVDYQLGDTESAAILTGANSGGKSTLLELIAQLLILHHWGLPVPARRATIPILDELRAFTATRGADAGAFETFLRELFPPLAEARRRFVLLDEVEGVTELEAAGRVLGTFLDELERTGGTALLVTHLPDAILRNTRARVRIDGIDAVGLDERFNLLVDRQPKLNHRARSTPELIVRRVHAKASGATRDLYARLLARWGSERGEPNR